MSALRTRLGTIVLAVLAASGLSSAQTPAASSPPNGAPAFTMPNHLPPDAAAAKAARTLTPYFAPAKPGAIAPDADGFVRRWLLLAPIDKPNRTNTVFTGTYVRDAFAHEYFPGQATILPHDGEVVKAGEQTLKWHALDSSNFNVTLFRFAYGLNKQVYGVIFWAVTMIDSPREMKNVRLAVGSNSASMWWLNGENAANLFGDRRMVMDDVMSKHLTLKKGRNVLRGAVINGPGLSDFCLRFVDDHGQPIRDITVSTP